MAHGSKRSRILSIIKITFFIIINCKKVENAAVYTECNLAARTQEIYPLSPVLCKADW